MKQLLIDLKQTQANTLKYFDLPASALEKTYAPGKWTVRELLNHIVDAETVLYDRVRRVIAEPKSVIWAFRQDDWFQALDYTTFPLEINKGIYVSVRAAIIYLAKQHYTKNGEKVFVHSETGLRTLKDEFNKIAWHNQHHLKQIEQALGEGC